MLIELSVRDFGIIEDINWQLEPGLNVITGETGAGKSLVIDALETLLGARSGNGAVRHGSHEATIEGILTFPDSAQRALIVDPLAGKGIQVEADELIINCNVRTQGHTVFRINRQAVPRQLVNQIGKQLIDIHGQSEHLALLDTKCHLELLDTFGGCLALRREFRDKLMLLRETEDKLDHLRQQERDRVQREDFLEFQINEIRSANLQDGEEDDLSRERRRLASIEKLTLLTSSAHQVLSGEEVSYGSVIDQIRRAGRDLQIASEIDSNLDQPMRYLEEVGYGLEEIARDLSIYIDSLEFDPKRLAEVESRLELISQLKRKYGESIPAILDSLHTAEQEREMLATSSEKQTELESEREELKTRMGHIAFELSEKRKQSAGSLIAAVNREITDLKMAQVCFDVKFSSFENTDTIPLPSGEDKPYGADGIDKIEFTASTNPGEPPKALGKIASTGEISRFMLALKSALSKADNIPVVVFDEIDIGVGGRTGEIIGRKLWLLGQSRQVICITHLPQIAAFADSHFSVGKEFDGTRTSSRLRKLEGEPMLAEIAAMLSGPDFTETTLKSARELADRARKWKQANMGASG